MPRATKQDWEAQLRFEETQTLANFLHSLDNILYNIMELFNFTLFITAHPTTPFAAVLLALLKFYARCLKTCTIIAEDAFRMIFPFRQSEIMHNTNRK
jgi:hypothetical protein